MQKIPFTKMQGAGNDFVVIDATKKRFTLTTRQIKILADRHFGIGCDQVLLIERSPTKEADFGYRIFNADASEAEQCGNGARCIARFIRDHRLSKKKEIILATKNRRIITRFTKTKEVSVNMGIPLFEAKQVPFITNESGPIYTLQLGKHQAAFSVVNLGNPHAVIQVADVVSAPVEELGPAIEAHPQFPEHVNVGFMQILDSAHIRLRVYERGAGETLACGSGACAAVAVGKARGLLDNHVTVAVSGGNLKIHWDGPRNPIWMAGPAEQVFVGEYCLT